MLWEAMSGRRFSESTPSAPAFRTRTSGLEPRIRQLVPDADPQLAELCDRALAVEAHDRFPSAEAFRLELEGWLAAHGGHVQPAQIGKHMRELFSEDRRLRHEVIEQSMLEAGATHSVMQQLPVLPAEPPPAGARPRSDSSTGYRARTPPLAGERLSAPPPSGHRASELPPRPQSFAETHTPSARPAPGETLTPSARHAHGDAHTPSARPTAPRAPQPRAAPAPASSDAHPARALPRPPWVSAALLCALALAVFVITYQLSRKVASPGEAAAPSSSVAASAAVPPEPAAAPVPAEPAPRETSVSAARDVVNRPSEAERRSGDAPSGSPHAQRHAPTATAEAREEPVQPRPAPASAEPAPVPATPSADTLAARAEGKPPGSARTEPSAAPTKTRAPVLRVRNDPSLGSDLRELRRSSTMRIDVEDPYQ